MGDAGIKHYLKTQTWSAQSPCLQYSTVYLEKA